MRMLDLSPAELGIEDVDMQDDSTPNNYSGLLDLEGYSQLTVLVTVVNVGTAGNGTAVLLWQRYDKDGTAVGEELDLATAIDTSFAAGTAEIAVTIIADGLATAATNGTISTDAKHAFPLGKGKLNLKVTVANDGTSSTGNARLYAS